MTTDQSNQGTQTEKDADYLPLSVQKAFFELQFLMNRSRIEEAISFAYSAFKGQVIGKDTSRYGALRRNTLNSLSLRFKTSEEQSNAILLLASWRLDHEMRQRER